MTEEPEQVLVEDRVTAAFGREEGRAEVAVRQQHGDGARQNRQRQKQQEGGDEHRPAEQRHLVQRHAGRAHVEDGGDEVDGAEDRRCTGDVQGKDRQIDRGSRMTGRRQRRIHRPATACAVGTGRAFHEEREQEEQEGRRQQPERDVVQAREGHVRSTDHDRDHPVGKTTDQGRHDHEEDHHQGVRRGEDIVHVLAAIDGSIAFEAVDHRGEAVEDLDARLLQLHAHDDGHQAADDTRSDREDQVEGADVLVVGRE